MKPEVCFYCKQSPFFGDTDTGWIVSCQNANCDVSNETRSLESMLYCVSRWNISQRDFEIATLRAELELANKHLKIGEIIRAGWHKEYTQQYNQIEKLKAELEQARAERDELISVNDDVVMENGHNVIRVGELETQLLAAKDALWKFGYHAPGCDIYDEHNRVCDCGLSAEIAKIDDVYPETKVEIELLRANLEDMRLERASRTAQQIEALDYLGSQLRAEQAAHGETRQYATLQWSISTRRRHALRKVSAYARQLRRALATKTETLKWAKYLVNPAAPRGQE